MNSSVLLNEFRDALELEGKSPRTIENYHEYIADLLIWVQRSGLDILSVQRQDVMAWLKNYKERFKSRNNRSPAPGTIQLALASIQSFYVVMWRMGHLKLLQDPTQGVPRPKKNKKLPPFLHNEDMERLCKTPPKDTLVGLRDRAILRLFCNAGIRKSEIANLRIRDIDLRNRTMKVMGKGSKERIIPLCFKAFSAVDDWLRMRETHIKNDKDPGLFISIGYGPRRHRRLHRDYYLYVVKKRAKEAGIPRVWSHLLRHSFATHLWAETRDLLGVQMLLGHSSPETTKVYVHADVEQTRSIVGVFDVPRE